MIVFGVGFLLGPVRVFWLELRLRETIATLCEAPFLLIAIVLAARWLPRTLGLKANVAPLAEMGIVALLFQQLADFAVGIVLRGSTPCQQFARLATPAGLIYVALLIAFAATPVFTNWPQRPEARPMHTALRAVKVIHTLVWALFVSCILAISIFAWRGRFGSVVVLAILVFIEIAVLITNGWRCPLTDVAAARATR